GGGKVLLGDRGAFDGVDAALAIHPAGTDILVPEVIAIATYEVEYFGRAAHAAAAPERGANALDAAVLGYNAVAALRQHTADTDLRSSRPLGELYRATSARLGRPLDEPGPHNRLMVSTDMGNVSYRVPTIHPIVKVSPSDVGLHSSAFATWAASPEGDRGVLDAAKAM